MGNFISYGKGHISFMISKVMMFSSSEKWMAQKKKEDQLMVECSNTILSLVTDLTNHSYILYFQKSRVDWMVIFEVEARREGSKLQKFTVINSNNVEI